MSAIESLESRRHFVTAGIDPTFGTAGVLTVTAGTIECTLAVDDAVYVAARSRGGAHYLLKYSDDGDLDADFGRKGVVTLQFPKPAKSTDSYGDPLLARDRRTGSIYVAATRYDSTDNGGDGSLLIVQRVDANGVLDKAYGSGGLFRYESTASPGVVRFDGINPAKLQPLPHGRLLIAFDRQTSVNDGVGADGIQRYTGNDDVSLVRLRANGTRDLTFGRRGLANVYTGKSTWAQTDTFSQRVMDAPKFQDLQLLADGGYRVINTRDRHDRALYFSATDGTVDRETYIATQIVDSRVLNGDGTIDTTRGWSSALSRANYVNVATGVARDYRPAVAVATGTDDADVVMTQYRVSGSLGNRPTKVLTIHLAAGRRETPVSTGLPADVRSPRFVRGQSRGVFVVSTLGLSRLNPDLLADTGWGTGGVSVFNDYNAIYTADSHGRFVFAGDATLGRVDEQYL